MIDRFPGKYRFLSNFYPTQVTYEDRIYLNAEAAFQSAKSIKDSIRNEFTKLDPYEAKQRGKRLTLRPEWEDIKYKVMYDIVLNKFSSNPTLKEMLLKTGNEILIEGNTWGDQYWGVCNGRGQNKLGDILMKIREVLKETK
jgi:ribA/ribD-fused uncharacterized protein